ncbi:Hypothetical predicted protein [Marmota monax]|uniref:Uncharacterized protein n=1 Tax=Marmota monax TaxID=9995 RepID=A0A5E4A2K0_MARMO|nr:Hypothetical predicted protein [Marmota monax]
MRKPVKVDKTPAHHREADTSRLPREARKWLLEAGPTAPAPGVGCGRSGRRGPSILAQFFAAQLFAAAVQLPFDCHIWTPGDLQRKLSSLQEGVAILAFASAVL